MKKDIEIPKVEGVSVAVVKELNEEKTDSVFNVYLINHKSEALSNVLVSSKGYGENSVTGDKIATSVLRHFLGDVASSSAVKIEPIIEDVFGINNEYWVSFTLNGKMFDKKFIFLAETILEENMVVVPFLNQKGVVI